MMNDAEVTMFDDYWRTITRNEDYIRQCGHNACHLWVEKWHQDLEDAYTQVRTLLGPVTEPRMFHDLPGGLNSFKAENYHHALTLLLNPPEQWFGNIGMLCSPEYIALKRKVEEEFAKCNTTLIAQDLKPTTREDDLTSVERAVLAAIDKTPRMGPAIAKRISKELDPANIRRELSQLKKRGYIAHMKGDGYFIPDVTTQK